MADKEVENYLKDNMEKNKDKEVENISNVLFEETKGFFSLTYSAFQKGDAEGVQFLGMMVGGVLLATGKSIDQSLDLLKKLEVQVREDFIKLDSSVNKVDMKTPKGKRKI